MKLATKQFCIGGMTCLHCQDKISQTLQKTKGIQKVQVSYRTGSAKVTFDADQISFDRIEHIIKELDYEVLPEAEQPDISRMISLLVIILALYVLLEELGILNFLAPGRLADNNMGYGMLFVVGVFTSVHCIAMCGGINLSQSLARAESQTRKSSIFGPSVLYHSGRVIAYTLTGMLLGLIGMLFSGGTENVFSASVQGIIKLIAGIWMIIMGINMLGIFPWLRRFQLRMPRVLEVCAGRARSVAVKPLWIGLLNGLMPCGPLQAMQILALASGNPVTGGLSMLFFGLGTVPLTLGLGSIVSALGKRFAHIMMQVGAVLVVVMGLAMLSQGGNLSGFLLPRQLFIIVLGLSVIGVTASLPLKNRTYRRAGTITVAALAVAVGFALWKEAPGQIRIEKDAIQMEDGVQIVNSTLSPGQYPTITVQAGTPVKWNIYAPQGSINGCNYRMILSAFDIEYSFEEGDNIIEFVPENPGAVEYTCWMGMIRGKVIVV